MYDPSVGRWITEDPIGFAAGDADLYRYVGNDPTNAVDPTGLERLGQTDKQREAQKRELEELQAARNKPSSPKPTPAPGPGEVSIFERPAYCGFCGCEMPGLLPHTVVVVSYADGTYHTYSYDGVWHYDDELDRTWIFIWPFTSTAFAGLTGKDVGNAYKAIHPTDDSAGYGLFTHNCYQTANGLVAQSYILNGKPIPEPPKKPPPFRK